MIPLWLLKTALLFGVLADLAFMAEYWRDTGGAWMRDSFGITFMAESVIIFAILALTVLSVFFRLSRFNSELVGWVQIVLLFSVGGVLTWRTVVFRRERSR